VKTSTASAGKSWDGPPPPTPPHLRTPSHCWRDAFHTERSVSRWRDIRHGAGGGHPKTPCTHTVLGTHTTLLRTAYAPARTRRGLPPPVHALPCLPPHIFIPTCCACRYRCSAIFLCQLVPVLDRSYPSRLPTLDVWCALLDDHAPFDSALHATWMNGTAHLFWFRPAAARAIAALYGTRRTAPTPARATHGFTP